MRKIILGGLGLILLIGLVLVILFKDRIDRARTISTLFSGAEQYENFNRLDQIFPSTTMPAAAEPHVFASATMITLPETYSFGGSDKSLQAFLTETDTSALLVLKDGEIIFEDYYLTGGQDVTWLSMSVAKSFISALVGIALDEGKLTSIEDPITQYVPELIGSAYDGVKIRDILQMSSGARWNEDYSDPDSDINRFGRIFALGGSMNEFAATLTREFDPGTVNRYNSTDTQALGMLLTNTTGQSITAYMTEKLWHPMGAESEAHWLTDAEGMEMAFGGLNATARDYAKIGELYRNGGQFNGRRIVPADWASASVTATLPHLLPRQGQPDSVFGFGYGYQWWLPTSERGEFSAIGVYNQFVYVDPVAKMTIVKLSANSDYGTSNDESSYREVETFAIFRTIVGKTSSRINAPQEDG